MQYVCVDTNIWIYLANGTEPAKLLRALKQGVDDEDITLLIPVVVIDEWHKNKSKAISAGLLKKFDDASENISQIIKTLTKKEKGTALQALDINDSQLILATSENIFSRLSSDLGKARGEILKGVEGNIEIIEGLLSHHSTRKIGIRDNIVIKAGKFAVDRKAPFSGKNSFADALIVFSFIDYVDRNYIRNSHFITHNTADFCENRGGKASLHPDLIPDFQSVECQFHPIAGKAINEIYENIFTENSDFSLLLQVLQETKYQVDVENIDEDPVEEICEKCSHPINFYRVDLDDQRVLRIPGQLEFEFVRDVPTSKLYAALTRITAGVCSNCDTEHFICASCGQLNVVEFDEYDMRKECVDIGCQLPYRISSEYGDWHEATEQYTSEYGILTEKKTCQSCGIEFWNNGTDNSICEACEDEYYYGGIVS